MLFAPSASVGDVGAMLSGKLCLHLDSSVDDVPLAVAAVKGIATDCGLGAEDCYRVEACVTEALNNAVLHAYQGRSGSVIKVIVTAESGQLVLELIDRGLAMPEEPAAQIDEDQPAWENVAGSGRGWWIMRSWMDEVSYRSERDCNVVRMVKRFGATWSDEDERIRR